MMNIYTGILTFKLKVVNVVNIIILTIQIGIQVFEWIYEMRGDHKLMSVDKITYDSFTGDPFIDTIDADDQTKGAYQILEWAYQISDSYKHLMVPTTSREEM